MMPCLYIRLGELTIIGSDVALLSNTGVFDPKLDWRAVARHLKADQLRPSNTCLTGVSELLGGERMTVTDASSTTDLIWSPWQFAGRSVQQRDMAAAIAELRHIVMGSIASWAAGREHIILGLSGGLDSSIVAACLAAAGASFSCLALATDHPTGDERHYARAVANALGVPLAEAIEDVRDIDVASSDAAHMPRPIARSFAQSGDRRILELARRTGADCYFSGGGGDNVFCSMQSATPVADRLLMEGPGRGTWRTARDIALLADSAIWAVLARAFRRAFLQSASYRWRPDLSLLSRNGRRMAAGPVIHPWLECPRRSVPGKSVHIAWLLQIQNHLEGYGRDQLLMTVAPLLSQPIVELCLQIPTWMWFRDGLNRVIARDAFAGTLPTEIVGRRSKGTPDSFVVEIFEANRAKIWRFLADGLLAAHDIIDLPAILPVLDDLRPAHGIAYRRIMAFADVEAWARAWAGVSESRGPMRLPPTL
jgi:asparagine synthase (glutamine-hydrolysing)